MHEDFSKEVLLLVRFSQLHWGSLYNTVVGDARCHFTRIKTFNVPLLDFIQLVSNDEINR